MHLISVLWFISPNDLEFPVRRALHARREQRQQPGFRPEPDKQSCKEAKLSRKPCRQFPFDFLVRHGFTAFNLLNPLADRREKLHSLGNGVQPRVFRQSPDRIQGKLFVAHAINMPQRRLKGNAMISPVRGRIPRRWPPAAHLAELPTLPKTKPNHL